MDFLGALVPDWTSVGDILVKISLAIILGGAIGWERETQKKPAGFRTIIMICVGSTLIMMVSILVAERFSLAHTADPARIAAQVVTGIGFLGAGSIIQARGSVYGLTTAATIWVVAGLGLAIGAGFYTMAVLSTVVILLTLWFFVGFERETFHSSCTLRIAARFPKESDGPDRFQALLAEHRLPTKAWRLHKSERGDRLITVTTEVPDRRKREVLEALQRFEEIIELDIVEPR